MGSSLKGYEALYKEFLSMAHTLLGHCRSCGSEASGPSLIRFSWALQPSFGTDLERIPCQEA